MSDRLTDHTGAYSTRKIAWHLEALQSLREGKLTPPIIVQFMPTNVCNQACGFCSYGSGPESIRAKVPNPDRKLWKNQQLFQGRDVFPEDKMLETIQCLDAMGTKCVEITGGGEPLAYPWIESLLSALRQTSMETALVTNATLLTPALADLLAETKFVWGRVSIDAGNAAQYCKTRNVPESHWKKAWDGLRLLVERKQGPEAAIGVGMVIDRDNWEGIYECCRLAFESGADNVRISAAFTPDGPLRFSEQSLAEIPDQLARAKSDFECSTFRIHDLFQERKHNVDYNKQTYPYCYWKEIGCVIGADQNVYACCSWAYNKMGLMGTVRTQDFKAMWEGDAWKWRQSHDPRRDCRIHCLYERRNLDALQLMGDQPLAKELANQPPPKHVNFV